MRTKQRLSKFQLKCKKWIWSGKTKWVKPTFTKKEFSLLKEWKSKLKRSLKETLAVSLASKCWTLLIKSRTFVVLYVEGDTVRVVWKQAKRESALSTVKTQEWFILTCSTWKYLGHTILSAIVVKKPWDLSSFRFTYCLKL